MTCWRPRSRSGRTAGPTASRLAGDLDEPERAAVDEVAAAGREDRVRAPRQPHAQDVAVDVEVGGEQQPVLLLAQLAQPPAVGALRACVSAAATTRTGTSRPRRTTVSSGAAPSVSASSSPSSITTSSGRSPSARQRLQPERGVVARAGPAETDAQPSSSAAACGAARAGAAPLGRRRARARRSSRGRSSGRRGTGRRRGSGGRRGRPRAARARRRRARAAALNRAAGASGRRARPRRQGRDRRHVSVAEGARCARRRRAPPTSPPGDLGLEAVRDEAAAGRELHVLDD